MMPDEEMQVVVLMGGLATRLKDESSGMPKSMVDVHGKPFFRYQLELMQWHGLKNFVFCVGYKADAIEDYFKNGKDLGVNIAYSFDGDRLLGTAGAVRKALGLLKEDFLLVYGDSYMDVDYSELIYRYMRLKSEGRAKMLMAVLNNNDRFDKSNVVFRDGRVICYDKDSPRPEMRHIDYGISVMDRRIIQDLPEGTEGDLSHIYKRLAADGTVAGHVVRNRFYEIGSPASYREFKELAAGRVGPKRRAVLLDRDGTLNEPVLNDKTGELDSPLNPEELKLLPKTVDALRVLRSLGYMLIVVTNQPAAAKGKTTLGDLYDVNDRLRDQLAEGDVYLDDLFMCPHHPVGDPGSSESFLIKKCDCRKPAPGLLSKAIRKFNINPGDSYTVGDAEVDIMAGKAAGTKTVFLGRKGTEAPHRDANGCPDAAYRDLYEFAHELKKRGDIS